LKWLLLFLLAGMPALADPCPLSETRRMWRDWRPVSHLMIAVNYRKECGVFGDADRRAIRSLHESQGCSADTEVGQYFAARLNAPLSEETSHPGLAILRDKAPVALFRFCRMAKALPWPKQDAAFLMAKPSQVPPETLSQFQTFWAHLDAMQTELTRALTEITP